MRTHPICWIPLVLALGAAPAAAQAVHPGKHVRLHAPGSLLGRFEGVYVGRSGDTLIFGNDERGPVRVPSGAITQLDVSTGLSRRHGALRGAFWGAISVGLLYVIAPRDPEVNTDISTGEIVLAGTVSGAIIGAIIGAFVPARVYRAADPRILLNAASNTGSVGARLALAF